MNTDFNFVVLDTETTGLGIGRKDRIIEIALVKLNGDGEIIQEFETLVNPNRDIGPTHKHGILASDLIDAPVFSEIAGNLLRFVNKSIIVGHNVFFDLKMLSYELSLMSIEAPPISSLCTMQLASYLAGDLPSRKLEECCKHFGIEIKNAHTAIYDARAAASLLNNAIKEIEIADILALIKKTHAHVQFTDTERLNHIPLSPKSLCRNVARQNQSNEKSKYICRLIASLPPNGDWKSSADSYLEVLDRVLEDRRIEEDEYSELKEIADELNLTAQQVVQLNESYLHSLLIIALKDGEISQLEERDLSEVRQVLAISLERYAEMLNTAKDNSVTLISDKSIQSSEILGKSICFTGELSHMIDGVRVSREKAESLVQKSGMIVCRGVTKKLDYLVTADPDSMSGKAKKARSYGTRIISEARFWQMINN